MKRLIFYSAITLALLAQASCAPQAQPATGSTVGAPAAAVGITAPTATLTSVPTVVPTPRLPVGAGTAMPAASQVLSAANVDGMTELARWGNGQVTDAAYSPDGKSIAVATALGVSIYAADTLTKKMSIETKSPVNDFAFSPDGATVVTGLLDNSVTTWNAADGTMLKTYAGQKKVITDPKRAKEQVTAVAFSDDGSLLAAGSSEGFVNVWKAADGTVVQTFTSHQLQVTRVFFSNDSEAVFSASMDGTVRLTQLSDGKLLHAYGEPSIRDAAISRDGKILATYGQAGFFGYVFGTGNLVLWDVESGKKLVTIKAGDYKAHVQRIAFSPDGQSIAAGWSDYSVKVWKVADGSLLGTLEDLKPKTQLPKDWYFVVNPVMSFSPDGKSLMWAGDDSVAFLDPAGTTLVKKQVLGTRQIYAIALSPDGQTVASNEALDVHLRHFADGSLYADQPEMKAFGNVAFAPDGNSIAMGFVDSTAEHSAALLWPVTAQGMQKNFDTSLAFAWGLAAFAPDGKTMALGVRQEILIYTIPDGALVRTIYTGMSGDFSDMAFSGDGKLLVVSAVNITKVLKVEDGKSLKSYSTGGAAVAFAPDGTLLAGSDYQKNVRVWKVPTQRDVNTCPYASPCWEKYWKAPDEVVVTMADNPDSAGTLRFSNDGKLLVGGLQDGTIIVWSMPDGAVLKTWPAHSRAVSGLIFSPDGKLLISSSYDGTIRVWGLKP